MKQLKIQQRTKGAFLPTMILGTVAASISRNALVGRGVIRTGEGTIRAGENC